MLGVSAAAPPSTSVPTSMPAKNPQQARAQAQPVVPAPVPVADPLIALLAQTMTQQAAANGKANASASANARAKANAKAKAKAEAKVELLSGSVTSLYIPQCKQVLRTSAVCIDAEESTGRAGGRVHKEWWRMGGDEERFIDELNVRRCFVLMCVCYGIAHSTGLHLHPRIAKCTSWTTVQAFGRWRKWSCQSRFTK